MPLPLYASSSPAYASSSSAHATPQSCKAHSACSSFGCLTVLPTASPRGLDHGHRISHTDSGVRRKRAAQIEALLFSQLGSPCIPRCINVDVYAHSAAQMCDCVGLVPTFRASQARSPHLGQFVLQLPALELWLAASSGPLSAAATC